MIRSIFIAAFSVLFPATFLAQDVTITVNASSEQWYISPYLYGKNNSFSDNQAPSAADINRYKGAGLRLARENSGNNATKYNWRLKIGSHPDWYNNVYDHDWDFEVSHILSEIPGMQVMYAFQLLGKAASSKDNNFNDWEYNSSQWWDGVNQNLAGGGVVNTSGGSDALVEGDPDLYLMDWNADSTTGILEHWFGENGLGLPEENLVYWNMDNEPEIWAGTHDDVMPVQVSADEFIDRYIDVAKKARAKYPDIKLCGPVTANEWQWYNYADEDLYLDGSYYCWLEYFIKRVADEEKASGIRLLDVLDIHWYPNESNSADVVQLHRVFYDRDYNYPGANGVKTINGGWDSGLQKEFIFGRVEDWLNEHFGVNHGVGLGMSEFGTNSSDPNINSVVYASMLGTFANHLVELFSPWHWREGMWEVLHLYSRYAHPVNLGTSSSSNSVVSGYSSISTDGDSLTVILVNRHLSASREVVVNLSDFDVSDGNYSLLQLSSLPESETFVSHTNNALVEKAVSVSDQSFTLDLPSLSTTAVLLTGTGTANPQQTESRLAESFEMKLYPNPSAGQLIIDPGIRDAQNLMVAIYDYTGKKIESFPWNAGQNQSLSYDTHALFDGLYVVKVYNEKFVVSGRFSVRQNP